MVAYKNKKTALVVTCVYIIYTLILFAIYESRTLNDDINNHILAGEIFGVPEELKGHGIRPLYTGKALGWDGQFYYYISNDIFGLKDTANHIDAPSYRYQRVGLSLYVAAISFIAGNDWVSPKAFFVSYLFLIIAATYVGARLLQRFGVNPALMLCWSLSVGTQITLFNALPDAAADSFLILALGFLFSGRASLSIISFVFSGLSREVYVLFPSFIFIFYFYKHLFGGKSDSINEKLTLKYVILPKYYLFVIPGLIALFWNIYIYIHFGKAPASQAHGIGILGPPFKNWYEYLLSGLSGNHKLVGQSWSAYAEAISLILFMLVIFSSMWVTYGVFRKSSLRATLESYGIALALFALSILYICFGSTVVMHYTGYLKALSPYYFLIPLLLSLFDTKRFERGAINLLLVFSLIFTTIYNMKVRILPFHQETEQVTNMSQISDKSRVECFGEYQAEVKIGSVNIVKKSVMSNLLGGGDQVIVDVDLKNTGTHPFWSTKNFGSVYMSYHWLNSDGKVIQDGIRSVIPGGLFPDQTKRVSVISNIPPNDGGELSLVLSPVQEGCAWFYMANPQFYNAVKIHVR
jgi:hypothetical protein